MKSTHLFAAGLVLALAASGCGTNAESPTSPTVSTDGAPLVAPTDLVFATSTTGADLIRFTPSSSAGVSGYELYQYSPDPSRDNSYVLEVTLRANVHEYELPASAAGSLQFWRVVAVGDGGHSPNSETLSVRRRGEAVAGNGGGDRGPTQWDGIDN